MSSQVIVEEWRDVWSFKADYLFILVGLLVSTESIDHVSMIEKYSGAATGIAYVSAVLLCILPLLMMEIGIGQLAGKSPVQAMANICPLFKGVGVGFIILSIAVTSWTAVLVGHTGHYLAEIFSTMNYTNPHAVSPLPWTSCIDDRWRSPHCDAVASQAPHAHRSLYDASAEYYMNRTLKQSKSLAEPGELIWENIASTACVWFLVFLAICGGIRWFGKVFYLTVGVPLLLMFVFAVQTSTLPGATDGIHSLFTVDFDSLLKIELWRDIFATSLLSVSLCFGAYISIGSYNKRNNNLVGDSLFLIVLHLVIVVIRTFIDAGVRGHLKHHEQDYKHYATAFKHMPVLGAPLLAVSQQSLPHIWAALLLFKTIFFHLNKLYVLTWSCLVALEDAFLGKKISRGCWRMLLALLLCLFGFALSLGYTTQAGIHAIDLATYFFDLLPYWALLAFQIIAVAYFYCAHFFGVDVRIMVEQRCTGIFGNILAELLYILVAVPIYVLFAKMYDLVEFGFPLWLQEEDWYLPLGWILAAIPVLPVPLLMLYTGIKACVKGPGFSYWQKLKYTLMSPMRYEIVKNSPTPRYTSTAPGYVLLPQAPLAEPEHYGENMHNHNERVIRVSNI